MKISFLELCNSYNIKDENIESYFIGLTKNSLQNTIIILIIGILLSSIFVYLPFTSMNDSFKNLWPIIILFLLLAMILILLFQFNLISTLKILTLDSKYLKLEMMSYSKNKQEMNINIPSLGLQKNKSIEEFIEKDNLSVLYFIENLQFELNKEYEIQINDIKTNLIITKDYLRKEYKVFFPKTLILIIN